MKNSILTSERLRQLFENGNWSDEDKYWVLEYLESTDNAELRKLMEEKFGNDSALNIPGAEAERLLSIIHKKIDTGKPKARLFSLKNWKRLSIAASIIFITSVAAFLYFNNKSLKNTSLAAIQQPTQRNEVPPVHDNAILTLADGSSIVLDQAANGELAREGSAKVLKMDGQVSYSANGAATDSVMYNTMSTARGNQYHLLLADGSKVWLNAASSIKFPTVFNHHERRVEITGEAYFEVANDVTKPFIVKISSAAGVDGGEVQVLGTHFNINAYDDEPVVKTTLAEGKVKVKKNSSMVILLPSQQAVLNKENQKLKTRQTDLEKELAWKAGMFEFQDDDLQSIMRQISRWYDVEVSFAGTVSGKLYNGSIRRQATLSQVLEILKLAGVAYMVEGKNVTVKSN